MQIQASGLATPWSKINGSDEGYNAAGKQRLMGNQVTPPWSGNEGEVYTKRKREGYRKKRRMNWCLMVSLVLFCILQCFIVLFFS